MPRPRLSPSNVNYRPPPAAVRASKVAARRQGYTTPVARAVAAAPSQYGEAADGGGDVYQPAPFDFSTDPGYLAALAAEQTGSTQLDAALRAARERALVQFGDPSLAGAFGIEDLSPLTAAMTQQATTSGLSTMAQLQRERDVSQQNIQNQLAAHGLARSGDLGYRTGVNQQNYATSLYNAQQGVLDTLAENARSTALQKQQLRTNTVGALTGAYNTYVQNPQYWGMAAPATPTKTVAPTTPVPPLTAARPTSAPAPTTAPRPRTTAPVSRLATPSPYRFQVARNVRYG